MKSTKISVNKDIYIPNSYRIMQSIDIFFRIILALSVFYWISQGQWIPFAIFSILEISILFYNESQKNKIDSTILNGINKLIDTHSTRAIKQGLTVTEKIIADTNGDLLFIDDKTKKILIYRLETTGNYYIQEILFGYDEIVEINVNSKPKELSLEIDSLGNFTIGGALVGGIGGLITGSLIDSIIESFKGPKEFLLEIKFKLLNNNTIDFEPIRGKFGVTDDNLDEFKTYINRFVNKKVSYLNVITKYFKDKINEQVFKSEIQGTHVEKNPLQSNLNSKKETSYTTTSILPKIINCPSCEEELELEENERKERKFTCPECDLLIDMMHYTEEKTEINEKLSEEIICPYCEKKLEFEDDDSKQGKFTCPKCNLLIDIRHYFEEKIDFIGELPEEITCPNCEEELELEENERKERKFTCPDCNIFFDLRYYLEESKITGELQEAIECPYCEEELELEENFRKERKFLCPGCSLFIDMMYYVEDEIKYAGKLPKEIICPFCKEELELEENERKERKFTCPECNKYIDMN